MHAEVTARRHTYRLAASCLVVLATSVFATTVSAAADASDNAYWMPLPDATLAELRGGFDLANGLKVSFGIERAVYINGTLVTTTALNIGALGSSAAGVSPLQNGIPGGTEGTAVAIIREGRASFVQGVAAATNPIAATVIQNTMNDQAIRSVTTVNTAVNSLQILKTLNFGSAVHDALSAAVGPR